MTITNEIESVGREILVHNTSELNYALKNATGGETILLAPGAYDGLLLRDAQFNSTVTIKSVDPNATAVLTNAVLNNVSNLTFDTIRISYNTSADIKPWSKAFYANESTDIKIINSEVTGSVDNNYANDGIGLRFDNAKSITIENTEFHDLFRGAVFNGAENTVVKNNNIYAIRSDGFDFSETNNTTIVDNNFGQFITSTTNGLGSQGVIEHPGVIQFWTNGDTHPNENILIQGNVSLQNSPDGFPVGGIFLRDENGNLPYRNVVIKDNVIVTRDADSITVGHGIGVDIENNTVVSVAGSENTASISVWDRSENVVIANNITNGVLHSPDSNAQISNNLLVQWQAPEKAGYYGDVFVNGLDGNHLGDVLTVPGAADGLGAVGALASLARPEFLISDGPAQKASFAPTAHLRLAAFEQSEQGALDGAKVTWVFPDGSTAVGTSIDHVFDSGGNYLVRALVEKNGVVSEYDRVIAVKNPLLLDIKFNGNFADSSESAYAVHASAQNFVTLAGQEFASFQSTDQPAYIDDVPQLSGLGQLTLQFDLQTNSKADGRIVWLHQSFGAEIKSGKLGFSLAFQDGSSKWISAGSASLDGNAHSAKLVYDGSKGTADVYIDGVVVSHVTGLDDHLAETSAGRDFYIGGAFGRNYSGLLDNLKIYSVAALGSSNDTPVLSQTIIAASAASLAPVPVNNAPVAKDDAALVDEDKAIIVNVLGNDVDADGDKLSLSAVHNGAHGTVALDNSGALIYTPDANFNGNDAFTYTVSDGHGGTATGTVNVLVNSVNDAPVAQDDIYGAVFNKSLTISAASGVLANDTDIDSVHLSAVVSTGPANGALEVDANGGFVYTPNVGFSGVDLFSYSVNDGQGGSQTAVAQIVVNGPAGGFNVVNGTSLNDTILGTKQADLITGGAGDDTLRGGAGDDIVRGGAGNDFIYGGAGNDRLNGGAGADQFRLDAHDLAGTERDFIDDLSFADGDKIVLASYGAGTFQKAPSGSSLQILTGGTSVIIDSYADLVELAKQSNAVVAGHQGDNDTLVLNITNTNGNVQVLELANSYHAYATAGGLLNA